MASRRKLPPGARKTSSGRITITMRDPRTGQRLSHSKLKPDEDTTYATVDEAWGGFNRVTKYLDAKPVDQSTTTVAEFVEIWTDPTHWEWGARRQEASQIRLRSATRSFVAMHGDRPIASITAADVRKFMDAGGKPSNLNALATLFGDAIGAGHLTDHPCRDIARASDKAQRQARRDKRKLVGVPADRDVYAMLARAQDPVYPTSIHAWLKVGVETGMRGGEIDAMEWARIDWREGTYDLTEAWNDTTKVFGIPKHHSYRKLALDDETLSLLDSLERVDRRRVFVNTQGQHWTHATRDYWWRSTFGPEPSLRQIVGGRTIYNATRHFWISRAVNGRDDRPAISPFHASLLAGHKDGGRTIIEHYLEPDQDRAIAAVRQSLPSREGIVDLSQRRRQA